MKKISHMIFDWNGTIIPDTLACVNSDNACLELLGISPKTIKFFRETFVFPVSAYYEYHGADPKEVERLKDEIGRVFTEQYEPRIANCRTRKGTRRLLEYLVEKRIFSLILSNHTVPGIILHLERLRLSKYFTAILGNQDVAQTIEKSKDQRLADYLKNNKIDPKQAIIIGDSCEEIELAKQFGLISIAITEGYVSTKRLRAAEPNHLVTSLDQVINIIESM